jgi:hypothetical protein
MEQKPGQRLGGWVFSVTTFFCYKEILFIWTSGGKIKMIIDPKISLFYFLAPTAAWQ